MASVVARGSAGEEAPRATILTVGLSTQGVSNLTDWTGPTAPRTRPCSCQPRVRV